MIQAPIHCRTWLTAPLVLACALFAYAAWADTVDVEVAGIEGDLATNVQRSLSIAQKHKESWDERRIQRLFRMGRAEAEQALRPYGYYNPQIKASLKPPSDDGHVWHATYRIKAGPPTQVEHLKLDVVGPGAGWPTLQKVLDDSGLHQGDQLHHVDYKSTKAALSAAAYAAGFLDAHFTQSAIRIDPHTNTADIALVMDTGERYYFGQVDVQQHFLSPGFVQRLVPIKAGDPFNANRLLDLQMVLAQTDYFSQVMINARRDHVYRSLPIDPWFYDLLWPPKQGWRTPGELRVPINVSVKPSKGQHYRISAGYGTDTGPRVGLGVKFRHINEYGHQLRFDARISAVERTLKAAYDIPIENVIRDRLRFTAAVSNQEFGDLTSNFARIGVIRDTGWSLGRTKPYFKIQYEHYDLHDGAGSRNSLLLYPGYTWTLRSVDSELHTRKGVALDFDIRGTSQVLGSDVDFLRVRLDGGLIWPMTERTRLLLRGALGAITADDFKAVPPSQRFFAGGGHSVRGYAYQDLSPTNGDDIDVGGRYLMVGSVEADYRFYQDFYVATFFDIGNAANQLDMDLKRGVGIGFRWASPVGMIRIDFAHPLDDPDTSIRIHFSLGPTF